MFGKEEKMFLNKWLNIDEYVAYKRKINCTNVSNLTNIGKYLTILDINGRI
jgi:hypothetical protein